MLTKMCLVSNFILDIFQISRNQSDLEKKAKPPKNFVDAGVPF